jgi:hypothetical protein
MHLVVLLTMLDLFNQLGQRPRYYRRLAFISTCQFDKVNISHGGLSHCGFLIFRRQLINWIRRLH